MTETYSTIYIILFFLLLLWTIPWKGMALWKAAKNSHKWWFIFFLIINTAGLLEIFYIFVISKWEKKGKEEKKETVEEVVEEVKS